MKGGSGQKIVIVGCGNVAWHIASGLRQSTDCDILVYNHRPNVFLEEFKTALKCKTFSDLSKISGDADVYFICVPDRWIAAASANIQAKKPDALLVHTSGSAAIAELGERVHPTAVFYPLQTFSRKDKIDWSKVPVIIESGSKKGLSAIKKTGARLRVNMLARTSEERLKLHLAAVFVNNFVNALYVGATEIIEDDFKVLFPLMEQTVNKVKKIHPLAAQTGPAKRNDQEVMAKHLALLEDHPALKKTYKRMSKLVTKQQEL